MNFKHIFSFILISFGITSCQQRQKDGTGLLKNDSKTIRQTTTLHWIDSIIYLGKINMGDTVLLLYRFRNTGTSPLVIEKAESGCSCTVITPFNSAIPAGEEGEIKAMFDTRKSITGPVHKSILVTSNATPAVYRLLYTAEIKGHKPLILPATK